MSPNVGRTLGTQQCHGSRKEELLRQGVLLIVAFPKRSSAASAAFRPRYWTTCLESKKPSQYICPGTQQTFNNL